MRRLLRVLSLSVFVLVPVAFAEALPSARPEEVGLSSERLSRIGRTLQAEIQAKKLPGAVALVARKGRVAYFEAFGARDPASGAQMAKDTVFRIYSMTKPLAAVGAMTLAEEGRIVLTDPVSKYLPAFAKMQVSVPKVDASGRLTYDTVPAAREMTIQDLLRHTSGLAYGEITANAPVKDAYAKAGLFTADFPYEVRGVTPAEEIDRLAKAPLSHQPGEVWEYSLSVDLLGRVVETVAGTRLSEFLEARLFKPLKMTDAAFFLPKEKLARLAQPFPTDPATGAPNRVIDVSAQPKNDAGGVGAVMTTMDYARFAQMMLNGGQLDGARILSRSTVTLMTSDHLGKIKDTGITPGELLLGTKGYTFGLGFCVRQDDGIAGTPGRAGEFMWAGAAGTYFWVDPKEQLVGLLMTQAPGPSRVYYRKLFKQLVYQAISDEVAPTIAAAPN
ncbi:MAG TPA: serine hydrolase domain-containing protein [Myxococcales bacterium]|nr:serine hydrolase domain-containing protein [Myxococcales bacterium]